MKRVISHATAAALLGAVTLLLVPAPAATAAGLPNCNQSGAAPCFETVWAGGAPSHMTFVNLNFPQTTQAPTGGFYVVAPQTSAPQGWVPFLHDHVVGDAPAHNSGSYVVHLRGYLVLCSAQGITAGGCVAAPGGLPLAKTVNGQTLTTVERIQSGAESGLLEVVDTGAVLLATVNPGK